VCLVLLVVRGLGLFHCEFAMGNSPLTKLNPLNHAHATKTKALFVTSNVSPCSVWASSQLLHAGRMSGCQCRNLVLEE